MTQTACAAVRDRLNLGSCESQTMSEEIASRSFLLRCDKNMNPMESMACSPLTEALANGIVQHPDGRSIPVKANISVPEAIALHNFIIKERPQRVIEIGMAYGVSTLAILSALEANGQGELISLDPYINWDTANQIALHQVARAGLGHRHQHRREPSYLGLTQLIREQFVADFIYIDGNHNFDYAFTDFFIADKTVKTGGVIAFNDAGWRSVFRVINFVRKYRKYEELEVGLPNEYKGRNPIATLVRWIQGRNGRDCYLRKLEDWEPSPVTLTIPGP